MPFNSIFPVALKTFIKDRFNAKSQSKSRPNLLEDEGDWGMVPPLSASTPNIFEEPMVTSEEWEENQGNGEDELVLDQLEVNNTGENFDWREGNHNVMGKSSDRVFAQAKRNNGKRRRFAPRRAGSEESLLDAEMISFQPAGTRSLSNLLDADYSSGPKKNATKRDACGHVVFKDDDWGFIKGLNYKGRDSEDVRRAKYVRK